MTEPRDGDALIIVDVQKDFLPGGALAVKEGDRIVPLLNRYIEKFQRLGLPIVATRDWHPPDHCSFKSRGGPWPAHCIAGTSGAEFAEGLRLPPNTLIVSKATRADQEAYSGFERTGLAEKLKRLGVTRLFIGGLATEYCVLNTVRDAIEKGFRVVVLSDAMRAVNANPGDEAKALEQMRQWGAEFVRLQSASRETSLPDSGQP